MAADYDIISLANSLESMRSNARDTTKVTGLCLRILAADQDTIDAIALILSTHEQLSKGRMKMLCEDDFKKGREMLSTAIETFLRPHWVIFPEETKTPKGSR